MRVPLFPLHVRHRLGSRPLFCVILSFYVIIFFLEGSVSERRQSQSSRGSQNQITAGLRLSRLERQFTVSRVFRSSLRLLTCGPGDAGTIWTTYEEPMCV